MTIPFNIPCSLGIEPDLVQKAIDNGHLSGNGPFCQRVHGIFEAEMGFRKVFMTHSCTGALEMAALLCDFAPGDEVILPSFTHVGTANAFVRAGAKPVFADSLPDHPNLDPASVEAQIGPGTRALVVVHYAGVACDLDRLTEIARHHNLLLIEDAAHAIGARFRGKLLGSFGDLAGMSFHETKNITCGQGGLLIVNRPELNVRAAQIWQNGTNRSAFARGETDHYTWVAPGGCFTTSDLNAAYLYGQLQHREEILDRRRRLWQQYREQLAPLADRKQAGMPLVFHECRHNGHIFYLRLPDRATRDALLSHLRRRDIHAVFHYIPLHSSPFFRAQHGPTPLPNCRHHADTLLRLPLFHQLQPGQLRRIVASVMEFFG
ncbi:MAG: dTDP-4-amino-4,6-dideoxygalactose transaminase [Bacteroidota bacterium]